MERRYYRQYENYDTVVPRPEDFPLLNGVKTEPVTTSELPSVQEEAQVSNINSLFGFKLDDIIIIAVIILLLMEEEKDFTAIAVLAILFLSGYIT